MLHGFAPRGHMPVSRPVTAVVSRYLVAFLSVSPLPLLHANITWALLCSSECKKSFPYAKIKYSSCEINKQNLEIDKKATR